MNVFFLLCKTVLVLLVHTFTVYGSISVAVVASYESLKFCVLCIDVFCLLLYMTVLVLLLCTFTVHGSVSVAVVASAVLSGCLCVFREGDIGRRVKLDNSQ